MCLGLFDADGLSDVFQATDVLELGIQVVQLMSVLLEIQLQHVFAYGLHTVFVLLSLQFAVLNLLLLQDFL